jgi:hypothetical protein
MFHVFAPFSGVLQSNKKDFEGWLEFITKAIEDSNY